MSELLLQHQPDYWLLTLRRPEKRNALSVTLITEFLDALAAGRKAQCPALIVTGEGPAFSAGMDLEALQALAIQPAEVQLENSRLIARFFQELQEFPAPTIAAVNGHAVAGGCGLAILCDFTLSVPTAQLGFPEVKIGFIPALVAVGLIRQVGEKRARDLLLTGRLLSAEQAMQWGMVNELVDAGQLLTRAAELAATLGQNSLESLRRTKRLLQQLPGAPSAADWDLAVAANAAQRGTPDFREGIAAFLEKRQPRWPSRTP
ncbi:MAG: enoyl-CoA hydratase/isomerase family protein [Terriglobales bacterium]